MSLLSFQFTKLARDLRVPGGKGGGTEGGTGGATGYNDDEDEDEEGLL